MKKNKKLELTIIIPTLNRHEEFPSAVISARNSENEARIIVSLNKSDRKTLDACSQIEDDRIQLKYWNERLDIGDHWSSIVNELVSTEYFSLIPDDDRINDTTYYRESIDVLSSYPNCVAAFADKRLRNIIGIIKHERISDEVIRVSGIDFLKILRSDISNVLDICPTHYTTILRTSSAKNAGLYPNCHSPDLLLFARMCKLGDVIILLKDPGQYNWNENGLSKKPNLKMLINEANELASIDLNIGPLGNSVRDRLVARTMRALYVASIRCLKVRHYTESFLGFKALGFKNFVKISASFLVRFLTGKWPKLSQSLTQ